MGKRSRRVPEGTTEQRGFGVGAIFLRKLRKDLILREQHSKINKTLGTTFARCRCKCNMLHDGEK